MALEFLSGLSGIHGILIVIIFILFVLAFKKVMKIVMNAIWITVAAVIFPIVASRVFGLPIPSDANTIITFITIGLGAYFIYLIGASVYTLLKYGEKIGKKVMPDFKPKKPDKVKAKRIKEPEVKKDFSPKNGPPPLIKKQLNSQVKPEKEMFRDYMIIEENESDPEIDDADVKEEKKLLREPIKEIKFPKKKRRKG